MTMRTVASVKRARSHPEVEKWERNSARPASWPAMLDYSSVCESEFSLQQPEGH